MKTVLVTTEFPPQPGGIGHHACSLAKYLNRQGIACEVLCESRGEADFAAENAFDLSLPFKVHRISRKGSVASRFFLRLKGVIEFTQKPNLVLMASGFWPLLLVGGLKLLGIRHQKAIYIAHAVDINPSNKWLKKICHFMLSRFDSIVAVSKYTREKLPSHLQEKTIVIPNGFDLERFSNKHTPNGQLTGNPRIVTLGSVTARKGQINVVNALPAILKTYPDAHYHLIGLPLEKEAVLSRAKDLGVQEHIHFHGALDDSKMIQYLSQADLFMMLSNHTPDGDFEGFGIAILEAAYLGVPAIGSRGTGIEDAISHGKSGLLVDPHRQEEVTAAVKYILEKSAYFKEECRVYARAYSWELVTPRYVEVLRSLSTKV